MQTFNLKKLAVLLAVNLLCICAHSQTFQVTTTADSGPGSLRDALTSANASGGGTIVFTSVSGTISLQSALPDISVDLAIAGSGPEHVAIDGNRLQRIFHTAPGTDCKLSGLSVQGGLATTNGPRQTYYAAILSEGSLSISNCCLHDNGAGSYGGSQNPTGGALVSTGSSLVLNNVTFSNNISHTPYAALSASNVSATNCLFIENSAGDWPPISVSGDSVFSDTTFTQNKAFFAGDGGGLSATGNLTLLNCDVTNNYGDHNIGGIYFQGNNLFISNCKIDNNLAETAYGGIVASGSNIVIRNSSISGNHADTFQIALGGNIYLSGCTISSNTTLSYNPGISAGGTLTMTNCTISGNSSAWHPGSGGSGLNIGNSSSVVWAVNCTIAFNGAGVENFDKATIYALNTLIANNGTDFSGTLTSQGHNLIGNLDTNTIVVGSTNGDIYGLDPLLGPLQNNGGLTPTHALIRGSSAINAGTSIGAPPTDQRGIARPCGKEVDIGAFEYDALLFTDISRVNSTNIHVQVEGPPGSRCTIQASSNLLEWENVFVSGNVTTGIWEFVDQDASKHPNRFYRALTD